MYKNIVVTGGLGFIGINFVHYVYDNYPNVTVTIVDKQMNETYAEAIATFNPSRVRIVIGDILNVTLMDEIIAQTDAVVHFAAESHNDNALDDAWPFVQSNIIGTYTIIEACRKYNKRLHHVSTDEVYGDLPLRDEHNGQSNDKKFTETTAYNPSNPYAATKGASDLLVKAWIRSHQLQATLSHCTNNYGPYQHVEKFIPRQITNILTGRKPKLYGNGKHVRDWIHVYDHVRAIWLILTKGVIGQTYAISSHTEKSNVSVIKQILTLMNKVDTDYDYVLDRKGHDLRYALDATKLQTELNWHVEISNFEEGLKQTIQWYEMHRSWWENQKDAVENQYAKRQQ